MIARGRRAVCWIALLGAILGGAPALAQQGVPPPEAERTPIPDSENPNLPGLSREERKKRQEVLIRRMLQERQRKAAGQPAEGAAAAPQPNANQAGPAQQGGAKPPAGQTGGARPNLPPGSVLLQKESQGEGAWVAKNISSVFERKEGYHEVTIFLDPASAVATVGETFITQCKLLSLDKSRVNRISLYIKYPPEHVEPVSLHQDRLAGIIDGEPNWGIDREAGVIRYAAKFNTALDGLDSVLLGIVWRALEPAEGLEIALEGKDRRTAAYWGDTLLTENQFGKTGGLLGASLRINAPERPVPQGRRVVEDPLGDYAPALAKMGDLSAEAPTLSLDYVRKRSYEPGEWVIVDLRLDNPGKAAFDELRLALAYDPAEVEVIDADEKNLIKTGVNVLDGTFREFWGWDTMAANQADETRGVIDYRVGTKTLRRPPSGVVARAVLRIKRASREPLLQWVWSGSKEKSEPTTGFYLLGESLLPTGETRVAGEFPRENAPGLRPSFAGEKADPEIYRQER